MLNERVLRRANGGKVARAAAIAALAFLLALARMLGQLAPFAVALFAAGVCASVSPATLLLGCVAGSVRFPIWTSDLTLPVGCATVLLGVLTLERLQKKLRLRPEAFSAILAFAGVLVPGLAAAHAQTNGAVMALLAAAVASASAPALREALLWRPGKNRDVRAPAALVLFAALMGACALWPPGAYFLACVAVLFSAERAPGAGALTGALTGCALLSGGCAPVAAVCVSLGGAAAGVLAVRGRLYAAPGFVLAAGLASLYAPQAAFGPVPAALAALVYLAVPARAVENLMPLMGQAAGRRSVRAEASRALGALGAAFGEIAAGVANAQEEPAMLEQMRRRLCAGCERYGRCWAGEDAAAVRLMCRTISDFAVFGETRAGDDAVPPDVARICRRGERLWDLAREQAAALRRHGEDGRGTKGLFAQAERILTQLSREAAHPRDAPVRLKVEWGASARSMYAGAPSGDIHLVRELPDGRVLALLCDGMGTGEAAREESERAARLLWKFLCARVEPEAALAAANALLLARGGLEMFATVDLCLIDRTRATAQFWKLAASRSLLAHAGGVRAIAGGHLPLGVLEGVEPGKEEVQLRPDDVIVIASDGVMEAQEGALEAALEDRPLPAPGELAERLLRTAEATGAAGRRDDMTVICLRMLWARAP